jgi:hypothetical protein
MCGEDASLNGSPSSLFPLSLWLSSLLSRIRNVIPGGESRSTGFEFALPASVLQPDPDSEGLIYALKVLKQPGTLAIPLTVRVHLPAGAKVRSTTPASLVQDKDVLFETDLRTDLGLRVVFSLR